MTKFRDLVDEYRRLASEHEVGTQAGDYRRANRAANKLLRIRDRLQDAGPAGEEALTFLLTDEADAVAGWAAVHCLPFAEEKALARLETIAGKTGMTAFSAQISIKEWNNGNLGTSVPNRRQRSKWFHGSRMEGCLLGLRNSVQAIWLRVKR